MSFSVQMGSLLAGQTRSSSCVPRAQTHMLSGPSSRRTPAKQVTGCRQMAAGKQSRSAARRGAATVVCAAKPHKVALLGAAGGIGQPLGLLLKMQPYVSELALYDIANVKGVAADLSHCNTPVKVSPHPGRYQIPRTLVSLSFAAVISLPAK